MWVYAVELVSQTLIRYDRKREHRSWKERARRLTLFLLVFASNQQSREQRRRRRQMERRELLVVLSSSSSRGKGDGRTEGRRPRGRMVGCRCSLAPRSRRTLHASPSSPSIAIVKGRAFDVYLSLSTKRPYPIALAGLPISSLFNPSSSAYTLTFTLPPTTTLPSVLPEPDDVDTSFSSSSNRHSRTDEEEEEEASSAPPAPLTAMETTIFFPSRVYGVRHSAEDVILKCSEGRLEWRREEQRLIHHGKERWTKVSCFSDGQRPSLSPPTESLILLPLPTYVVSRSSERSRSRSGFGARRRR
jgi:hypothetical protein